MATKNEAVMDALLAADMNPREAYSFLAPAIGIPPLEFTYNSNGGRYPRTLGTTVNPDARQTDPTGSRKPHRERTQHEMCLRMCYAVANDAKRSGNVSADPVAPAPAPVAEPVIVDPVIPSNVAPDTMSEIRRYRAEVKRLRAFVVAHGGFDPMDSMRVTKDGVLAILAGIPVDGLLAAIVAPWQEDTRAQSGIAPFDYAAWGRAQKDYDPAFHAVMPYVKRLIEAGVMVYLHGPAGTGKSSVAKGIADLIGSHYHEVNLAGAMASAIKGKVTPDGVKTDTAFLKAYAGDEAGVIALEEFDATHPNGAVAMNNGLANGEFHNDVDNHVYVKDERFRPVATANTLANGASKQFAGRSNLDGATKDRFRIGRVYVGLDEALEDRMVEAILATAGL